MPLVITPGQSISPGARRVARGRIGDGACHTASPISAQACAAMSVGQRQRPETTTSTAALRPPPHRQRICRTVISAGSIPNDDETSGHGCLAEARIWEELEFGAPRTSWLHFGDEVWMDAVDAHGRSVFGSIQQPVVGPGRPNSSAK